MQITDDILVGILKDKVINNTQLFDAQEFAKSANISLRQALVEKDFITNENLGLLIANYLKIPYVVLSKTAISEEVLRLIPERVARKQRAICFSRDTDGIKVAFSDPTATEIIGPIEKKTGQKVIPYFATEQDIFNTLSLYRKDLQKTFDTLIREAALRSSNPNQYDAPVAKIVDLIIDSAYQNKASDIHIEPEERNSIVRFRIDGILHAVLQFPIHLHDRIVTRIKVMSKLRTDEHLAPQDGKIGVKLYEENLDLRVSIVPIVEGEKVVLRLLASKMSQFTLKDLGMNEVDLAKVTEAMHRSYGMILSTGPTGSGKSTSIYAILKILNTSEKNITTIEDPVEYRLRGINQIQVNAKTNLTFASGLRSILRQDPNIVFVGEIRDSETAGIAVNAALTGHLVLSTLHTNDSATALPRLIDMHIEPFLVASTVNVIIAQRLVRKICQVCKAAKYIERGELVKNIPDSLISKYFGNATSLQIFAGIGCKLCHNTGYAGRIGIFEVLTVSKEIKKLITQKFDSDIMKQKAVDEGMSTMLDDGMDKIVRGQTTLEEVLRVTKVEK
ncbi:hypothetical protein A3D77_01135 [Candidatus Gottesmanbacteria bacterium RIFCSPHIGHO2_02_FULL_39_11]|uniref:AAA+ ATPase domain-containing protein n=1 Tax=Candidatus Gottesmanbacteria bacterium RIFCSPHIGHO2_02_FULL_39_11 TaxID=1798382 RepID=A0A1F5ZJ66_9BACT|nr:MAG: hypothetical protein A3D77_01135 [Candidatus Gottesmanbacteria bacterium RIFCSPHIGHO2_02_FULL_39_11]